MAIGNDGADSQPIRVSIACRDPVVREGIANILSKRSAFLVVDVSGESTNCLNDRLVAATTTTDVVIADHDNALILADRLYCSAAARQASFTKIVVISSRGGATDIRNALEHGIAGYVLQGCPLEEIMEAIVEVHYGHLCLGRTAAQRVAETFSQQALTIREIDVLQLIAEGYGNKLIAHNLEIAVATVKSHITSILRKLDARTRTQAVLVAQRRGMLSYGSDLKSDVGTSVAPPSRLKLP